jgi:cardiolipin synthase
MMRRVGNVFLVLLSLCFTGCVSFRSGTIKYQIDTQYAVTDPQFFRSMGQLLGPGIVPGNKVTALVNGDQIFPEMLAAIQRAQKTITFETYIYWSGEVGARFTDALVERARAGVKVHLLLDWFGSSRIDSDALRRMEDAGVEVEKYHPLFWKGPLRVNHRDHRKLLVVDGRVGFTGGAGIADLWLGNGQDAAHWRDTQFKLEGPAVGQMQAAFMDNWMKTRNDVLHSEDYFPALGPAGNDHAQVFFSSPRDGVESVRLMYLLSIAAARKNIRLASPYFVPGDLMVEGLVEARKRGVEVEVILPGPITDTYFVGLASRDRWEPLLKAGVKIYEYQPTMYHTKVMIVDDIWVSVGSANIDSRSFRLNDEANLNVFSRDFAAEQIRIFEMDKAKAREVSPKEWHERGFWRRLGEALTGLMRSQL